VAVFAEGADADEARAAGADIVGGVELIDQIASKSTILHFLVLMIRTTENFHGYNAISTMPNLRGFESFYI
jgi:ribosomal protein L1